MSDWQERALQALTTTELSHSQIAQMVGRSRDRILALAREHGIKRPSKQKGRRPIEQMEKHSPTHVRIGLAITLFRGGRSIKELANELSISPYVLRNMEFGVHDFTLTQLQSLSNVMGVNVEQLVSTNRDRPET